MLPSSVLIHVIVIQKGFVVHYLRKKDVKYIEMTGLASLGIINNCCTPNTSQAHVCLNLRFSCAQPLHCNAFSFATATCIVVCLIIAVLSLPLLRGLG